MESQKTATDPLDMEEINVLSKKTRESTGAEASQSQAWPFTIRFKIASRNRELEVPLASKAICLGRVDPTAHVFPEVDLTDDNGASKSVSRRHARVLRQGDDIVIEDLASVNGTFVNGRRLAPYLPETLDDGDMVQLGKLLIEVRIHKG